MYVYGGLCLSCISGRWSKCTFVADFVETALVEDGVSVCLRQTLLKLH